MEQPPPAAPVPRQPGADLWRRHAGYRPGFPGRQPVQPGAEAIPVAKPVANANPNVLRAHRVALPHAVGVVLAISFAVACTARAPRLVTGGVAGSDAGQRDGGCLLPGPR